VILKDDRVASIGYFKDDNIIAQRWDEVVRLRAHIAQWLKDTPSASDKDAYEEAKTWEMKRQGWIDGCKAAGLSEQEAEKSANEHFATETPAVR
jgi:hypothetical protein